ncbi:MAG: methionine synthase, partial [Chloroflexi bacterium]|nr:methionine synthase [Chloroflexota bacterium]
DVIFVVAAYLSAYNARAHGVHDYITSLMFNSPAGLSDAMDLAKMLAVLEMAAELETLDFRVWRQTRTGLLSYPVDSDLARAHLAVSVYLQMALKPHIIHVVGYTEADHAATASEVIESCKLARRAIENALRGQPDMTHDPAVQFRKEELLREARVTLDVISSLSPANISDPLTDVTTLTQAVRWGILDAPQLGNNPHARGEVVSRIDSRGACIAIDPKSGQPIDETARLAMLAF